MLVQTSHQVNSSNTPTSSDSKTTDELIREKLQADALLAKDLSKIQKRVSEFKQGLENPKRECGCCFASCFIILGIALLAIGLLLYHKVQWAVDWLKPGYNPRDWSIFYMSAGSASIAVTLLVATLNTKKGLQETLKPEREPTLDEILDTSTS